MRNITIGLSEFLARGVALGGALLASRRVRFWAAVLATALVVGALSVGSARANDVCDLYGEKHQAAPSGSDERILYAALWNACAWGGVNRAEEIHETRACLSDFRKYWKAPSDSDEEIRYFGLFTACVLGGENRAEEIHETGACLSDFRKGWKAPGDEEILPYGLFTACVLGGENLAEEIRETGACLSDFRKYWKAFRGNDEVVRPLNLWKACVREISPARRQETVAASFGVQAFETIVDDMVEALKEELGQNARPTLLIVPIDKRVGEDIDTQLINESIRNRLSKVPFFTIVSRNLETILKELQLAQSDLADSDTAVEIGRLIGAQYVLYGTVANINDNQQTHYRVVLALIETETGVEVFVDAARVRK